MTTFSLTVLNPGGKDAVQEFPDFAGVPGDEHAPVNFHAYAACTGGSFQRDVKQAIALGQPILMLIRQDFKASLKAIRILKESSLRIAVLLKETGFHQFASQVHKPARLELLKEILSYADLVISPTEAMVPIYRSLRSQSPDTVHFVPTPYPVDCDAWDFSVPVAERKGIFLGTRELNTLSRNHLQSLILVAGIVKQLSCPLTIVNRDGRIVEQFIKTLGIPANLVNYRSRCSYTDYLRCIAQHRIVFQLDQSLVPGQVAGDCCLCRTICVGGNGTIESIAFPAFVSADQNRQLVVDMAIQLLTNDSAYAAALNEAADKARDELSFAAGKQRLISIFAG